MIVKDVRIDYGNGTYYEEEYFDNGQLSLKGVWINTYRYGYHENYLSDGRMFAYGMGYYLNSIKVSDDNAKGYCLIWCKVVLL